MRLHLRLSPNTKPVDFDHLHQLTGALHKWLGENNVHDGLSQYSFGWLRNARAHDDGLNFQDGTVWTLSFSDSGLGKQALAGIVEDPEVTCGMQVVEAQIAEIPTFETSQRFVVDGAVLTRQNRDDGGRDHLTYKDPASAETLTRTLRRKLDAAGMADEAPKTSVRFDNNWSGAKTKVVTIKGIRYRTSVCPVIVEGPPEAVRFAWLAGVGELTGSGLGALR